MVWVGWKFCHSRTFKRMLYYLWSLLVNHHLNSADCGTILGLSGTSETPILPHSAQTWFTREASNLKHVFTNELFHSDVTAPFNTNTSSSSNVLALGVAQLRRTEVGVGARAVCASVCPCLIVRVFECGVCGGGRDRILKSFLFGIEN